jgi:hypothetical protein
MYISGYSSKVGVGGGCHAVYVYIHTCLYINICYNIDVDVDVDIKVWGLSRYIDIY